MSRTQVTLDQLDLDLRKGEAISHSGQVLTLTTATGDTVRKILMCCAKVRDPVSQ